MDNADKARKIIEYYASEGWEYIFPIGKNKYSFGRKLIETHNGVSFSNPWCYYLMEESLAWGHQYKKAFRPRWLNNFIEWSEYTWLLKITGRTTEDLYSSKRRKPGKIEQAWNKFWY